MSNSSRRTFIKSAAALSAAATGIPGLSKADDFTYSPKPENLKILFQGDSITDGNRTRDNDWNHIMGHGYAYIISSKLWFEHPERKFHFFNRGISGNKVNDLATRWQKDTLDIEPDILSILVGINDVDAGLSNTAYTAESYESSYRTLLKQTKTMLPKVKLVICEPFILPVGRVKNNWAKWHEAVTRRRIIAGQLVSEFDAVFVPLQQPFNDALAKAPADYWIWDGIHPMPAGHQLIANEWLKAVNKGIKLL